MTEQELGRKEGRKRRTDIGKEEHYEETKKEGSTKEEGNRSEKEEDKEEEEEKGNEKKKMYVWIERKEGRRKI